MNQWERGKRNSDNTDIGDVDQDSRKTLKFLDEILYKGCEKGRECVLMITTARNEQVYGTGDFSGTKSWRLTSVFQSISNGCQIFRWWISAWKCFGKQWQRKRRQKQAKARSPMVESVMWRHLNPPNNGSRQVLVWDHRRPFELLSAKYDWQGRWRIQCAMYCSCTIIRLTLDGFSSSHPTVQMGGYCK